MAIKGVLLDLSGVLYVGSDPVPGALPALQRLQSSGLPLRYITNTTRSTRRDIYTKLKRMGFAVREDDIFTAPGAIRHYLGEHELRPHFLIHPGLEPEVADLASEDPSAVVLGDAGEAFTYERLNLAFRLLMDGAPLIAMGNNKYFKEADGLSLDVGPFMAALEYAADTQAVVLGKPARAFFLSAVAELGCAPGDAVMVGDDALADVQGALEAGLQGILVRTGKYREGDDAQIKAPGAIVVDDIGAAVEWVLAHA